MVYAWPPAKKTGGIAGFGRYGMVGPFGGDCGVVVFSGKEGEGEKDQRKVTGFWQQHQKQQHPKIENLTHKNDDGKWRVRVVVVAVVNIRWSVPESRVQKESVYSRCWQMQVTAAVVVAVVIEKSDVVIIVV